MKIPSDIAERDQFYDDLIDKCTHSQDDRAQNYARLRHYYLFGRGPDDDATAFNKIQPHIETLVSFLFASETTKFSIHLDEGAHENEYHRVKPLNRAINDVWLNSNADHVFGQGVLWAEVMDSTFIKLIVRNKEIIPFMVDSGSFGVLREDLAYTDRQEAMVHSYYTTRSQLEIDIAAHPNRAEILKNLAASPVSMEQPNGLDRILITASTPTMTGNVNMSLDEEIDYIPDVIQDLVRMHELWVWDDNLNDYRVVTRVENGVTIFDRKNFFLEGEHPFIQICPNPMYSFFWGRSEVAGMIPLQRARNKRMAQIDKLLELQVKPPTAITGWSGLLEEKNYAMFSEGSMLSTDSMQAKVDRFAPNMPNDLFAEIREIDNMFAELSGLQNILMGKGETGVRSGSQTSQLARLSSARIKKRALIIEDALEAMTTLMLKLMQKYDPTMYLDDKNQEFVAAEFTDKFVVKVDAHSNSPLFVEDQHALADELLKAGAITKERYIELISPPDKELILRELKGIEAAEQKQHEEELQVKMMQHQKAAPESESTIMAALKKLMGK